VPESVLKQLQSKGHEIQLQEAYCQAMGRGNAVMFDSHGIKYGASDPRADGEAIPEHPMYWEEQHTVGGH
jgi:gamma-glutamyltranspeptidase/glutathione hydrolase